MWLGQKRGGVGIEALLPQNPGPRLLGLSSHPSDIFFFSLLLIFLLRSLYLYTLFVQTGPKAG